MSQTLAAGRRSGVLSYISLFTSFGTLLCCALSSLLVLLGLGVTVASFLSAVPWLVTLSRHKNWVFAGTACPADAPDACASASRFSRVILWVSAGIYGIGVFSAYVLGPLLMRFGG